MSNTRREGRLMRNTKMSMTTTTNSIRRSRITIAIIIGFLFGCIFASYFPHGLFVFHPPVSFSRLAVNSDSQVASGKCRSNKRINFLKAEFALASETNSALKKQIRDLTEKLQVAKERKDRVPKQVFFLGEQPKAGPFGTVKGLRTYPAVSPDESINPRLAKILSRVAIQQELIVTLANFNVKEMLEFWFNSIKRVGISNYLVVALDEEIAEFCKANGVPVYKRSDPNEKIESVGKTRRNHAVSELKFRILREFLQLGYSALFSDINIIYLQKPFYVSS